jgi:hypothetical protein
LVLVYLALILAVALWFTYLSSRTPYTPPSPQTFRNPIHDARLVR